MNHILILFAYIKFLRKTCRPATEIYESSQASYKLFRSTLIDIKKKKRKEMIETSSSSSLSLVCNKSQLIKQNFTTYRNENDTYSVSYRNNVRSVS